MAFSSGSNIQLAQHLVGASKWEQATNGSCSRNWMNTAVSHQLYLTYRAVYACSESLYYYRSLILHCCILISQYMRRCQIGVQFESRARTKFLATLFQPMTSMSDYQSVPWSHSFQKMYNTHMCKMHLIVEK